MALSDSNHQSKVFVSATPYNAYKDDPSSESPLITFKCNIKMSYISDKPEDKSIRSYIPKHDSWHIFQHPANDLTKDFISDSLVDAKIPFELTDLHWKKRDCDKESIPLSSPDCVISSIFDASYNMITAVRESGRKNLFMLVMFKKQVTVPHEQYKAMLEAMLKADQEQEILQQVVVMIRLQAQGWKFCQSDWEAMEDVVRKAGLGHSISNALHLATRRATSESSEQARVKLEPATATSIQALETVQPDDDNSKDKCTICMEEMGTDYQIKQMPCSHMFHGDCIGQWLKISPMCPICRFKLPTI